jgi:membrane fusion protein, multidrug efflux system
VRAQPVQVAGADGNEAVIAGGLDAGQVVVTAGVHVLNAGQKVKFYVDPGVPSASSPSAAASGTVVTVK